MNIVDILKSSGFPDDGIKQIEEAFEAKTNEKAADRVAVDVAAALAKQEAEHKEILKKVYEAAEAKRETDVKAIEAKNLAGLKQLIEAHKVQLETEAVAFRNETEQQISDFLDEQLAVVVPTSVLEEAANNNVARQILSQIREVAGMDDTIVKGNVKKALLEGKKIMDEQAKKIEQLEKRAQLAESIALIESKTTGMPQEKKDHIKTVFKNRGPKFIAENFDYVSKSFDREESTSRADEGRRTREKSVANDLSPLNENVDNTNQDNTQQIDENSDPFGYLEELRTNW